MKVSPEGQILNEASTKCKPGDKPPVIMDCNYGECNSGYSWRPGQWSKVRNLQFKNHLISIYIYTLVN